SGGDPDDRLAQQLSSWPSRCVATKVVCVAPSVRRTHLAAARRKEVSRLSAGRGRFCLRKCCRIQTLKARHHSNRSGANAASTLSVLCRVERPAPTAKKRRGFFSCVGGPRVGEGYDRSVRGPAHRGRSYPGEWQARRLR